MSSFLLRPRLLLAATALWVPLAASGACGSRTACFEYTQAEYDLHMSCPAQASALANFNSPSCPGSIVSVDSPGSFDGEICCYSVTYSDVDQSCANGGGGMGNGGPGAGPTTGTSTTFPGSSSSGIVCGGSCADALNTGFTPCAGPSLDAYNALQSCAGCGIILDDGGGACASVCGSFCADNPVDSNCTQCLVPGCTSEWSICQGN